MRGSILVVDDDPIIRMDLREMLEEEGYQVVGEAGNGEQAVDLAARLKPELVIMDVKMPLMNGIKAAQIIRRMQQLDTAILLLTAYSQRDLVRDAREAGVTAYLVKPVSEEDLIPAVEIALSQREKLGALQKDLEGLKQSIEDHKQIDKAKRVWMKATGSNEEQAHRALQRMSMKEQLPLRKLADRILTEGVGRWSG